jgi:hypothetical protein
MLPPVPPIEHTNGFLPAVGGPALRHAQPDPLHRLLEGIAILGLVNGLRRSSNQDHAILIQRSSLHQSHRRIERRLPSHGRKQRIWAFSFNDFFDHIQRNRFDVRPVREFRIRHDGRRIAVDEDHPVAFILKRLARLSPGIIEFAGLPDHDRPRSD